MTDPSTPRAPAAGHATPIVTRHGPGIARIVVPLPFEWLRFVNAYVLSGDDGLTLIDCGTATTAGYEHLVAGLDHLGFRLDDVSRVIGSHFHVDHIALANRLVAETGCDFVMHRSASERIVDYNDWALGAERMSDLARDHGASAAEVASLGVLPPRPDWAPHGILPNIPVEDGAEITITRDRSLRVIYTPGHDLAHICLVDSETGILFSGDHVLPRISPVVLVAADGSDALADYLHSLERVVDGDFGATLPAHGVTIPRGADRARQIILHHRRRLDEVTDLTASEPRSGWELMRAMFRPHLDTFQQRLAFGETLAHTRYLLGRGLLEEIDDGGVIRYRSRRY
jgi:glyoxylase-like metal-dependent hydrolase (beta-lactamase superfamily II)